MTNEVVNNQFATGDKSIITPPVGIWMIDKHSSLGRFVPLGHGYKSAISLLEVL